MLPPYAILMLGSKVDLVLLNDDEGSSLSHVLDVPSSLDTLIMLGHK
jgi:hypothetical protein